VQEIADEAHPGDDFEPWEIRPGPKKYTAIVEHDPGSEHTGEEEIAESLSRVHPGKHYVLHFHEDSPWVAVFEGGKRTRVLGDSPYEVAKRLGVSLEPTAPPRTIAAEPRNALVIEGATSDEVAKAFEVDQKGRKALGIERVALGVRVDPGGPDETLGAWAYDLSTQLGKRVYVLSWFPDRCELLLNVVKGGREVARFEWPPPTKPEPLQAKEILGKSTPQEIARALGLDWDLPAESGYPAGGR
jgi:hypothetical protein